MKNKLVECKSFGVHCTDETARHLDSLYPTLPSECRKVHRKAKVAQMQNAESRTCIATITSDDVDADKAVVLPNGIDRSIYNKNPVVLYCHRFQEPPIASCMWIKPQSNGLVAKARFPQRPNDYQGEFFPDLIYELVRQGIMKGVSIGFIATKVRSPTPLDLKSRHDWEKAELIIEESLLLEYSICPLGLNPEALITQVKGIDLKKLGIKIKMPIKPKQKRENINFSFDAEKIAQKALSNIRDRGKF